MATIHVSPICHPCVTRITRSQFLGYVVNLAVGRGAQPGSQLWRVSFAVLTPVSLLLLVLMAVLPDTPSSLLMVRGALDAQQHGAAQCSLCVSLSRSGHGARGTGGELNCSWDARTCVSATRLHDVNVYKLLLNVYVPPGLTKAALQIGRFDQV